MAVDDLAWADGGGVDSLGEIYCLTFIRDVDAAEALRRMGGLPGTFATRTWADVGGLDNFDDGYPEMALALPLGGWTVVFESEGFNGRSLTSALSHGTEVLSVLRHDYASPGFAYAVDGVLITGFDPTCPYPHLRYGADPDRLLSHMLEVGFDMGDNEVDADDIFDEDGDFYEDDAFDTNHDRPHGRCLRLIERLTGRLPTFEALTGPLMSAQIEPWFARARNDPAVRPGYDGPVDAVAEVRRLTSLHGLTDTPGLTDALAAAERGQPVAIAPDSPLGEQVRSWLTEDRRAHRALNGGAGRWRMTEIERDRASDLRLLARALGAAIQPRPTTAG
ncbi:DUF6461 domain-containing protein [Nocardia goodfellowii]|uniref:Uncharacterized protein n=1 Tax=Nocardia goodfellowii TaxID=882446 RepID=A0ABS4QQN9_9NOCA|nr:DUF6461 domain-containing protein [Nocardia goodfellowii]MBP2192956.1 hypothetical protein [Nocardia goodfellowii]